MTETAARPGPKSYLFEPEIGSRFVAGCLFAQARQNDAPLALKTDLFLPAPSDTPVPLIVWLGPQPFRRGAPSRANLGVVGRFVTRAGIALAGPTCRQGAAADDLLPDTREGLAALHDQLHPDATPALTSAEGMAVVEDICALLSWAEGPGGQALGLSGDVVLVGTALGAVMALHVSIVAPKLGLKRPDPKGVISFSGSCAWPSLLKEDTHPILAVHNPSDRNMPVAPLRQMADADHGVQLLECMEHAHGSIALWPEEPHGEVFDRITSRVQAWVAKPA